MVLQKFNPKLEQTNRQATTLCFLFLMVFDYYTIKRSSVGREEGVTVIPFNLLKPLGNIILVSMHKVQI